MATSWLVNSLVAAIEKTTGRIVGENRAHILDILYAMSDDVINKAIIAFADNLPSGGVKSFEWSPIKNAIAGSIPDIDEAVNKQIEDLFSALPVEVQNVG